MKKLTETNFQFGKKYNGKVRDTYDLGDKLLLITTDRQSAFDRVLASVPFKGQVLNQTSAWWFEKTKDIIPNHLLSVPDPNAILTQKCDIYPVEFVIRGYITGTTSTAAWTNYQKGIRNFCGNELPEGLRKNQKFDSPIITPTTKSDEHDESISPTEIVGRNLMTQLEWDYISKKALKLFKFGQEVAREHGLILVDTKYEFGRASDGTIMLVDEIHTSDSSRYWIADSYEERFARGEEPEYFDKEFLRLWFKDNCDPYNDEVLPKAPDELVEELSRRYIAIFEKITGEKFQYPSDEPVLNRLERNLNQYLSEYSSVSAQGGLEQASKCSSVVKHDSKSFIKAVLIMGSIKDEGHARKITDALGELGIQWEQHVASAHKQAREALEILDKYKNENVIYVTIAGRSNALSGFVAGNSDKPTIACPPFSDKMDMLVNIHSTIQMPSNVPVMTVLEPGNVALAIQRIANTKSV